jgi:hypothetical protein
MGTGYKPVEPATLETYDRFLALLNPATSNRYRSASEISDGHKRLRRLILTDGIPDVVSCASESAKERG